MRRHLFAVLLGCTALTAPGQAQAGPVLGFVQGVFAAISGATVLAGSAATAGGLIAGYSLASTLVGGFLIRTVLGLGLSFLAQSLQPGPDIPKPAARMVNFAQPVSYSEYVFGRVRKGGPLGFTGFNQARYYAPILAAHPCEGVVQHWIDERIVTLDGAGTASNEDVNLGDKCKITFYDGGTGQAADPELLTQFPGQITAAHDFKQLTYGVIRAKKPKAEEFARIYPTGRQWAYTPVFDGWNEIFDPRDDSTGYSNNAALVIAHWLTVVLGRSVDWDAVGVEADVCDEVVTNREGGEQPRWTINGVLSDDMDFELQRAQLAGACDAFFFERTDGSVGFYVGRYQAPDITLEDADFYTLNLTEGQAGPDAPTEVAGEYVEPENNWRQTASGVWVEDAGARRVRDTPQLFMVNSHNQCARINKRIAKTRRAQYQLQGSLGPIGYDLIGKRFVRIVQSELGLDAVFEVGKLVREGVGLFSLTANSVAAVDFAFDADTEEPQRPSLNQATLVSVNEIEGITGVTAANLGGGAISVDWDAQEDYYQQQIRLVRTDTSAEQIYDVPQGQRPHEISGLIDGVTYEVSVRNVSQVFRDGGSWTDPPVEVVVLHDTAAPAALVAANALAGGAGEIDATWSTDNDGNQYAVEVYVGPTTTFAAASLVETVITPANTDSGAQITGLTAGTYYAWLVPINGSGVAGTSSGPFGPITVT